MVITAEPHDDSLAQGTKHMQIVLLVTGAAGFYALTMVLMKYWGSFPPLMMAVLIGGAFIIGAWCEVEALRTERLSAIYISVLAIECVIISLVSFAVLGEDVSIKEVMGGVLVLAGITLAAT